MQSFCLWPPACKYSSPSLPCPLNKPTYSHRVFRVLFRKYLYPSPWDGIYSHTWLIWGLAMWLPWNMSERDVSRGLKCGCVFGLASCASVTHSEKTIPQVAPLVWALNPRVQPRPTQLEPVKPQPTHRPGIEKNTHLSFWGCLLHSKNWLVYMNTLSPPPLKAST